MSPRLTVVLLVATVSPLSAQTVRLDRPDAVLEEQFADIRGIRELPDGTVLISDYLDQRVVQADFRAGTVRLRVREGAGPAEARIPTRLIPARGDSTLLVDLGNARLQVIDGTGRIVRTIPAAQHGMLGVRGVSRSGELYFAIPGWADADALANDSVRVVRFDAATNRRVQVAVVQGERMRSDAGQPSRVPRIPIIGYASADGWVIDDEGSLRIVRGGDYRVEALQPGGGALRGASNAYPTRAVTRAERLDFVRRFAAQSPTSGRGADGGLGQSEMPSERELLEMTERTEFAERHPYFDPGRVVAAPGGMLWVGRPAAAGAPVQYDRFDRAGARVGAVTLSPGRRVVSVTRRGVYVVAEDSDGLQTVERYRLP